VHTIGFDSVNPFDHVCRALDVIRKMGFALVAMQVNRSTRNTVQPCGELTVSTLMERISSCVGVSGLTHDMSCAQLA
jgi:hypothetical protein